MNLVTALALFWDTLSEAPGGREKGLHGFSGTGAGGKRRLTEEKEKNPDYDHDGVGDHEDDDDYNRHSNVYNGGGGVSPYMSYTGSIMYVDRLNQAAPSDTGQLEVVSEQEKGEKEKSKNNEESVGGGQGDDGAGPSHGYVCDLSWANDHHSLASPVLNPWDPSPCDSNWENFRKRKTEEPRTKRNFPAGHYKRWSPWEKQQIEDSVGNILEDIQQDWSDIAKKLKRETTSESYKEPLDAEYENAQDSFRDEVNAIFEHYYENYINDKSENFEKQVSALKKVHTKCLHFYHEAQGFAKMFLETRKKQKGKLATQSYLSYARETQAFIQERMTVLLQVLQCCYVEMTSPVSNSDSDD